MKARSIYLQDAGVPFQISDLDSAKEELREVVDETTKDWVIVDNPITDARGQIEFQKHATPAIKVLSDQIDSLTRKVIDF